MKVLLSICTITFLSLITLAECINPAGIIIGGDSHFKVSVKPDAYPDRMISWIQAGSGAVDFPDGNTGRVVRVRGTREGAVSLAIQMGDCPSVRPCFNARVVTNTTVGVSMWILSDGTNSACTVDSAMSKFDRAREVWRQVGVDLQLRGVVVTNFPSGLVIVSDEETGTHFDDVFDSIGTSGTVNCCFVNKIWDSYAGLASTRGVMVSTNSCVSTLAHEIGHVFELEDIFDETETGAIVGPADEEHTPSDWNGGTGVRFYEPGTLHPELIRKMLMYGFSNDTRADITIGDVFGLWEESVYSNGVWHTQERMSHAPVGFFTHGRINLGGRK